MKAEQGARLWKVSSAFRHENRIYWVKHGQQQFASVGSAKARRPYAMMAPGLARLHDGASTARTPAGVMFRIPGPGSHN